MKSFAVRSRRAGLAEVRVDDDDLIERPAERDRAVTQRILPRRTFGVLKDLPERGLTDIEIRGATQVARRLSQRSVDSSSRDLHGLDGQRHLHAHVHEVGLRAVRHCGPMRWRRVRDRSEGTRGKRDADPGGEAAADQHTDPDERIPSAL